MESTCLKFYCNNLFDVYLRLIKVRGLRKLCIVQSVTNDENVNLGVYPESDPENMAYPNLFTVRCPFDILGITKVQYHKVKFYVCVSNKYSKKSLHTEKLWRQVLREIFNPPGSFE